MNFVNFITKTPLWIWGVLAFFVDIGLKSLHKHTVYIPRMFLIPVIMIILKYQDAVVTNGIVVITILFLLLGSAVGIFFADKTKVLFDKKAWTVQLPGSYVTFTFLSMFFTTRFIFEYLEKNSPGLALGYTIIDVIISTLFTGYFLGRAGCFSYKFYKQR